MTHRRTRQNRHTKNRRCRRQKGGDLFTNQSTPPTQPSQNNENSFNSISLLPSKQVAPKRIATHSSLDRTGLKSETRESIKN